MNHFAFPSEEQPFGKGATIQMYNGYCGKDKTIKMCCDHVCDKCNWKHQTTLAGAEHP